MYGTYFYCNLAPGVGVAKTHAHKDDHHHSDTDHKHKNHSHEKEDAGSGGCCSDFTNAFLNEAKLLAKQLRIEYSAGYVFLAPHGLTIERPVLDRLGIIIRYVDPPPKVSDIRIFIQSFII